MCRCLPNTCRIVSKSSAYDEFCWIRTSADASHYLLQVAFCVFGIYWWTARITPEAAFSKSVIKTQIKSFTGQLVPIIDSCEVVCTERKGYRSETIMSCQQTLRKMLGGRECRIFCRWTFSKNVRHFSAVTQKTTCIIKKGKQNKATFFRELGNMLASDLGKLHRHNFKTEPKFLEIMLFFYKLS